MRISLFDHAVLLPTLHAGCYSAGSQLPHLFGKEFPSCSSLLRNVVPSWPQPWRLSSFFPCYPSPPAPSRPSLRPPPPQLRPFNSSRTPPPIKAPPPVSRPAG